MAHNVVVLKSGAKQIDFANAAAMARATDFIPAGHEGPGAGGERRWRVRVRQWR